nr:acyltransferase [Rhodobacter sp. CZR27]
MSASDCPEPSPGPFESYRSRSRFGSLDGLRFLCISAVLWHHLPYREQMADVARILTRGFAGVDFFFVLSGFLITTLLMREASANGRFSLSGFYKRRALRILPVYFLLISTVGAYYIWIKGQAIYIDYMPFYYLFMANFLIDDLPLLGPTWSLSVEEQYYLLWPLILMLLPRPALVPALGLSVILCTIAGTEAFGIFGIHGIDLGLIRLSMPPYSPILIGSALAVILHDRRSFAMIWPVLGHRLAAPVSFATLVVLWQVLPENLLGWPNLVMHLTMAACLASIAMREDHPMAGLLRFGPVARIGMVSYGIYLYHLIALHFANMLGGDGGWPRSASASTRAASSPWRTDAPMAVIGAVSRVSCGLIAGQEGEGKLSARMPRLQGAPER